MSSSDLTALLIGIAGLVLLGATVWAWRGRSRAARFWMPETLTGDWRLERCVLLGAPAFALLMLTGSVMAVVDTPMARTVGGVLLLALCLPMLYFVLAFLPIPHWLYPQWAKEIRAWRREADADLTAWLEQRRSR